MAKGFNANGRAVDVMVKVPTYSSALSLPNTPSFLMVDEHGTLFFSQYFDGGKSFPANPVDGQLFFHDQLFQVYKYVSASSTWTSFPCVAIAKFANSLATDRLETIFPFNTWWWDEVIWEETQPDFPSGLTLSHWTDTANSIDYLRVDKGSLVTPSFIYSLKNVLYKRPAVSFDFGNYNGSSDGSYTNVSNSIVPSDITPLNTQGFSITSSDGSSDVFSLFNTTITPKWAPVLPVSLTISFPQPKSVNKYVITTGSSAQSFPKEWAVLGTIDGENWDIIDSRFETNFASNTSLTYTTNNNKQYNQIRVRFFSSSSDSILNIDQITFYCSTPKLNVFLVTDGVNTDIITSIYSSPLIPNGLVSNYHQIGTVCIDDSGYLFNFFPEVSLSTDILNDYAYISEQLSTKATSDLSNVSTKGLVNLTNLCLPNSLNGTIISQGTVYLANNASYLRVLSVSGTSVGNITVYGDINESNITNSSHSAIIHIASPVDGVVAFMIPIPKGFYFKYLTSTGDVNATLIPMASNNL